jgi:hypothetical protein
MRASPRYLSQLETADRHGDTIPEVKVERLKGNMEKLRKRSSGSRDQHVDDEERGQADLAL